MTRAQKPPHHAWAVLYVVLVGAIYVGPVLRKGVLIAGDHPFYLAVALSVDDNLRSHGELVGWSPDQFAGFPVFSPFLPAPLAFVVMSLLKGMTSISVPVLYKALVVLSVILPALGLWILLSQRLHWAAALAAVNMYLLLTYHLVQPLQGMWMHYLGVAMTILVVHGCDRWLTRQVTFGQALSLVLFIVGAAAVDAFTWPTLLVLVPLAVGFYSFRRRIGWARAVAVVGLVACLGILLLGVLGVLIGSQAGWGVEPSARRAALGELLVRLPVWFLMPGKSVALLEDVLPAVRVGDFGSAASAALGIVGEHLPEMLVVVLSIWGLRVFWANQSRLEPDLRDFLQFVGVALGFFLLCVAGPWHFLDLGRYQALIAPFRQDWYVVYVNVCLIVFAAYALWEGWGRYPLLRGVGPPLLVVLLLSMHVVRYATYQAYAPLETASRSVIHRELMDAWRFVRQHVTRGEGRVMYEELDGIGFLDGGATNLAALSTHETGIPSILIQRPKTNFAFRQPPILAQENPFGSVSRVTELMRRLNCQYLVLWHLGIRERLLEAGVMEVVYQSENRLFSVLRLKDYRPTWLEFDRAVEGVRVAVFESRRMAFELENPYARNGAVVKMTYHPFWVARVNGEPRAPQPLENLIRVDELPRGKVLIELSFLPMSRRL